MSPFEQVARTHEKLARDLETSIPQMPPASKAPIMREVAHHLECAARMRGQHVPPLSLKAQAAEGREMRREFSKGLRNTG
jgi:hypothetical protein